MWNGRSISLFVLSGIAWTLGALTLHDILIDFSQRWYWLLIATLYYLFITELFFHCTLGHVSYDIDPQRPAYKILAFLAATSLTFGTLRGMIVMHETHHLFADQQDRDYLCLKKRWMTSGLISPLMFIYEPNRLEIPDLDRFVADKSQQHARLLEDAWTNFCDDNLVWVTVIWWWTLWLVLPAFLFNVLFLGRLIMSVCTLINTVVGHTGLLFGYRNFNTPDNSYNNILAHYFFLGLFSTLLHNNHHGKAHGVSHRYRWWEFDTGSIIARGLIQPLICMKK